MTPVISVIIPVYNSEEYLSVALDSILEQNFTDYEVLLIDDGSTDNSAAVAKEYAEKYPEKLFLYFQENSGAGAARNLGMSKARGNYLLFMDSDDRVEPDMLKDLYESACRKKSDIVFCPFYRHGLYQETTIEGSFPFKAETTYTGKDFLENTEYIITTCSKLYKTSFIKKFNFPAIWFEDVAWLPVVFSYAEKVSYVPTPYYHYLRHDSSVISSVSNEKVLGSLDAVRYIVKKGNPDLAGVLAPFVANLLLFMCIRRPAFADLYVDLLIENKDFITENTDFKKHKALKKKLNHYYSDYHPIPKCIYYDNFGKKELTETQQKNIDSWNGTLVEFDAKIICLDESNCDIRETPEISHAYETGNFDLVGDYFKCKTILKKGGIALSKKIRGNKYITPLLLRSPGIFAFYDDKTISSQIYATVADHAVLREIFSLFCARLEEEVSLEKVLSEYFLKKEKLSWSYSLESNFKAKYLKACDGTIRLYSTNVLTRDYGIGTSICSIETNRPEKISRDGREYVLIDPFYYQNLCRLSEDYCIYQKDINRQERSKLNLKLERKVSSLRVKLFEQFQAHRKELRQAHKREKQLLKKIDDIKNRKFVWFVYRISKKFFPESKADN